jgi:hypothetical protein
MKAFEDWENYLRALPRLQPGTEPPALRRARRGRKPKSAPASTSPEAA